MALEKELVQKYFDENPAARLSDAAGFFKIGTPIISKFVREHAIRRARISPAQRNRETSLLRYGVDSPSKLPSVQKKFRQTMLERYGAEYTSRVPELLRKRQVTINSKRDPEVIRLLAESLKKCPNCTEVKAVSEFYRSKKDWTGYASWCIICYTTVYRIHGTRNSDRKLFSTYGITRVELNSMLEKQQHLCKICKSELVKPHVDHDHSTGVVRGVLCSSCNTGLGMFKDNPESLRSAIEYLASSDII